MWFVCVFDLVCFWFGVCCFLFVWNVLLMCLLVLCWCGVCVCVVWVCVDVL